MALDSMQTLDSSIDRVLAYRSIPDTKQTSKRQVDPEKRANCLAGKEWLKNSISIWSDLVKSKEEKALKHPASFPESLVVRLLSSFLNKPNQIVLDPFMGIGSTLAAAGKQGHIGIGFELYPEFVEKATNRLASYGERCIIFNESAFKIDQYIQPESVNMVVTSPPYWNILTRRRTADYKEIRNYGADEIDLGNIDDYEEFLEHLTNVMRQVHASLKPNAYCVINVMDIRIKDRLYTFHSDLYTKLQTIGYKLDDIVIWDRRTEYNNLRPLGYPYRFRINRVHEFLLILKKVA